MSSLSKLLGVLVFGACAFLLGTYLPTVLLSQSQLSATQSGAKNLVIETAPSGSASTSSGSSSSNSSGSSGASTAEAISNETANWAGYEATGSNFTGVSGSWTVPSASSSDETAADAAWIGIGGVSSSDLIQVGTQNVVAPDGSTQTSAFYEMLPDVSEPIDSLSVNAGDQITASIEQTSSGNWTITLNDLTSGQSFSTNVQYDSSESSAEWIEEDPSDGNSQIPFDSFGSVSFTGASATENGSTVNLSSSKAEALTLVNEEGQALATTSGISGNSSFTVTRTSASSGAALPQFNSDPGSWTWHGHGLGGWGANSFGGGFGTENNWE